MHAIESVGETGFEPATPWSRTKCSTRLSHSPKCLQLFSNQTSTARQSRDDCRYNFFSLSFSRGITPLLSMTQRVTRQRAPRILSAKRLQPHEVANLSRVRKASCADSL